jgi:hypothetical protein
MAEGIWFSLLDEETLWCFWFLVKQIDFVELASRFPSDIILALVIR